MTENRGQFQKGNPGGPSRAGRRTLLTPERQEKIVQAILTGNYLETASAYAGVSPDTVREWLQRGESRHPTLPGAKYPLFFDWRGTERTCQPPFYVQSHELSFPRIVGGPGSARSDSQPAHPGERRNEA